MNFYEIIILAFVQGITEFLPISSSGHLVIVNALLSGEKSGNDLPTVMIVLHTGTLLSILVFYWHGIRRLLGEDRRVLGLLAVGTIPLVVFGLPVRLLLNSSLLNDPLLAGCMLPLTGAILIWASRRPRGECSYQQLSYKKTLGIGLFQALAILPGISRSGTTISAGLFYGLRRDSAATFAFLLAIPAIGGASVLEIAHLVSENDKQPSTPLGILAVGFAVSFIVGLVSLWWLIRWLEKGRLHFFALWCIPLGLAVVIWQLVVKLST